MRRLLLVVVMTMLAGCAGAAEAIRVAGGEEHLCKHCNCLMPAGVDPESLCSVCHCHKRAHQCVRQ